MIYDRIEQLIGNTPLLRIDPEIHGLRAIDVYAKLEYLNPFGSLKDRVAWSMLREIVQTARDRGLTVVESSSGNTAKALALLCGTYGVNFLTVTSRIRYPEVRMILHILGAQLEELPAVSECPDPFDPDDFLAAAKKLVAAQPDHYILTDQYFNPANPASHYAGTGEEILADLGSVDYFTSFLGTCGSTTGIGSRLREHDPHTRIYGVVSAPGNVVPGGRMSNELWEVGFYDPSFYNDIIQGDIPQAIDGMLVLNRRCGMCVGPTSGLTYSAMVERLRREDEQLCAQNRRANAVFLACDRMEPYTSFVQRHRPEVFVAGSELTTGSTAVTLSTLSDQQVNDCPTYTPHELHQLLADHQDTLVIDLRGHFAYSVAHLPDSMNIVDEQCALLIEQGPVMPRRRLVVVCAVGELSRRYAALLRAQGYDAASLAGGVTAWRHAGLPLQGRHHEPTATVTTPVN